MERGDIINIREAIDAAQQAALRAEFDGCDLDDIDQIIAPVREELGKPHPNPRTLQTYLNSLARSLRSHPPARSACLRLDAAMRGAGLVTDWEH